MESYFKKYHDQIIGQYQVIRTPYHDAIRIVYADWTASGRMYQPVEDRILTSFLPFVANTHTDHNDTGAMMTYAYHKAKQIIKAHVGANEDDVLIASGSGMTGVVNKFQRILGFKLHESFRTKFAIPEEERPVVLVTHMEHHSNQTSWLETIADVVIVPPDEEGLVSVANFKTTLEQYIDRKFKVAAITACSNVTGIITPYQEIAALMHQYDGLCFVDYSCSAPYVAMDMHADDETGRYLDAIYFSPHKFLGGPGAAGILLFNHNLYNNTIPDNPGGGTVDWTNPWGQHKYIDDIEDREDGGTPPFLQTIRAAMCMQLKDEMGVNHILKREEEILDMVWDTLDKIPNLHVLAGQHKHRMGVISFYIDDLHYNLGVKMLNDRFGIQTRGGCSCAGTYGHYLLNVTPETSASITDLINMGNCSTKPGWIRMSIHPTHTDEEIKYILDGIRQLAEHHKSWSADYEMDYVSGKIMSKNPGIATDMMEEIDQSFCALFA